MPSKGVQAWCYIAMPGCEVEFSVPGKTITKRDQKRFTSDHLEVESNQIHGAFNYVGQFNFKVKRNGEVITTQWVDINTLNGDVEKGSMKEMFQQTSYISNDICVTHLFYDAGAGKSGS